MKRWQAILLGTFDGFFGIRRWPVKPKPIYRWQEFSNGNALWLIEGFRRADGSVYRLPPVKPIWL